MVLVLWVLILLTACSVNNVSPETSGVPANMTKLAQGMWPRNEYTDGVPKPEKGTVVNGWIDSKMNIAILSWQIWTKYIRNSISNR